MLTTNPFYQVIIKNSMYQVVANLGDELSTRINSKYATIWEVLGLSSTSNTSLGSLNALGGVTTGVTLAPGDAATQMVWQSTDALEFDMTLRFVADLDAEKDVLEPVRKLIALSAPNIVGGTQNGLVNAVNVPNALNDDSVKISLTVGDFFFLDSIVIPNVEVNWQNRMSSTGRPVAAQAQITIRSAKVMYQNEILAAFKGAPNSTSIGATKVNNGSR